MEIFGEKDMGQNRNIQSYFLKISHVYFAKSFSQMTEYGIHPGQLSMLKLLWARDGLSQSEICRALKIKASTVAVSLKRLEKSGLIVRKSDPTDQRITRVYLTEETKQIGLNVMRRQEENEKIMLQGFSEAEICLLKRFLQQILENTELLSEKPEGNLCHTMLEDEEEGERRC